MPEIIVSLGDKEIGRYAFDGNEITVGRSEGNDVRVNNLSVSRRHAEIRRDGDRYVVIDLDSANGTYVNGARVARTQVFHDDKITVGKHTLRFLAPETSMAGNASDIVKTIVLDKSGWAPTLKVFAPNHRDARVVLSGERTRIGRDRDSELRLVDWFVDKRQAEILKEGMVYRLRNLSGRHATFLNDEPVEEAFLSEGDIIQAGVSRIVFTLEAAAAAGVSGGAGARIEEPLLREAPLAPLVPPAAIPLTAEWEKEEESEEARVPEEEEKDLAEIDIVGDEGEASAAERELVLDNVEEQEIERNLVLDDVEEREIAEPVVAKFVEPESVVAESVVAEAKREEAPALSDADRRAVAMWEKAMQNKSAAVRKQAAAQLKKLTGRDYAI